MREREPAFEETFVSACLRLIGETADVFSRGLDGAPRGGGPLSAGTAHGQAAPLEAAVSMMDMVLARSTSVRVLSNVAFRYA